IRKAEYCRSNGISTLGRAPYIVVALNKDRQTSKVKIPVTLHTLNQMNPTAMDLACHLLFFFQSLS
ncbi:hypothetical protein, partial [Streptococcus dysgalactiae]|uniref:hypothetical protein n=1 Tax=Streptococcus dysgalactiae TaxID=1334 RepID=UPI0019517E25